MKTYIYLASPYTAHKEDGSFDEDLMDYRYLQVAECFHKLVGAGLIVYCPIAMTHRIDCMNSERYGTPISPDFWYEFDKPFIQNASQLYVLKLPGWENSKGLQEEIKTALDRNLPIVYLEFIPTREYRLET